MSEPAAADRAVPALRVGIVEGVTLTKWQRIWDERFPRISLEVVEVHAADQRAVLDQAEVDLCFARLPIKESGLHLIPLYEEVPVVVVPKDHPASLFESVTLADLSGEDVVEPLDRSAVGAGRSATAELFDLVAGGAGIALVPQSVARSHSRRDLVYRPISDGTPTRIGLAWLVDNPHQMIEEFIGIVRGRTVNSSRSPSSRSAPAPATRPGTARQPSPPRGASGRRSAAPRPGRRRGR